MVITKTPTAKCHINFLVIAFTCIIVITRSLGGVQRFVYAGVYNFSSSSSSSSSSLLSPRGGGGVLGSTFAGYVLLASQNPYPIIVYSVTNYKPYLSHFWANG